MEAKYKVLENKRIDSFLKEKTEKSRNYIQKIIKQGFIKVNGKIINKPSFELKIGDEVSFSEPEPSKLEVPLENKPINIKYEDEHLLVIDKEAGLTIHPVGSKNQNTLVNRLLFNVKDLSSIGGIIRPGIVHRLDKETSGLMIVAKTNEAHIKLSEMFKGHSISRKYLAVVKGTIKEKRGTINLPIKRRLGETKMKVSIQGKRAITHFKVIERIGNYSLLMIQLETGRTHQIRVHLSHIGYPILGDSLYGGKDKEININRQFLHSYEISFIHPIISKHIKAYSMLPEELRKVLNELREKWKTKKL